MSFHEFISDPYNQGFVSCLCFFIFFHFYCKTVDLIWAYIRKRRHEHHQ